MEPPTPQQLHQWIEIDKLSQAELAKQLGISQATVSRLCTKHSIAATGKPGVRLGSRRAPRLPSITKAVPATHRSPERNTNSDDRVIDTFDSQV
jgi:hypothetical protein